MKQILENNIISLVCILIAAALAILSKDGWGWFMLLAIIFGRY